MTTLDIAFLIISLNLSFLGIYSYIKVEIEILKFNFVFQFQTNIPMLYRVRAS
jgi:hypothetical protein